MFEALARLKIIIKRKEHEAERIGRINSWGFTYDYLHNNDRNLCDEWEEAYKAWESSLTAPTTDDTATDGGVDHE